MADVDPPTAVETDNKTTGASATASPKDNEAAQSSAKPEEAMEEEARDDPGAVTQGQISHTTQAAARPKMTSDEVSDVAVDGETHRSKGECGASPEKAKEKESEQPKRANVEDQGVAKGTEPHDVDKEKPESSSCTDAEMPPLPSLDKALKAAEDAAMRVVYDLKGHTPTSDDLDATRQTLEAATAGITEVIKSIQAAQKASKAVSSEPGPAAPAAPGPAPTRTSRLDPLLQSQSKRGPHGQHQKLRNGPPHLQRRHQTSAATSQSQSRSSRSSTFVLTPIPEQAAVTQPSNKAGSQPPSQGLFAQMGPILRLIDSDGYRNWSKRAAVVPTSVTSQSFDINEPEDSEFSRAALPTSAAAQPQQGRHDHLPPEWELLKHRTMRNAPVIGYRAHLALQSRPGYGTPLPPPGQQQHEQQQQQQQPAPRVGPPPTMLRSIRSWRDDSDVAALGPKVFSREWSHSELREHRL